MADVTLKCPKCNTMLPLKGETKQIICTHCGNKILVKEAIQKDKLEKEENTKQANKSTDIKTYLWNIIEKSRKTIIEHCKDIIVKIKKLSPNEHKFFRKYVTRGCICYVIFVFFAILLASVLKRSRYNPFMVQSMITVLCVVVGFLLCIKIPLLMALKKDICFYEDKGKFKSYINGAKRIIFSFWAYGIVSVFGGFILYAVIAVIIMANNNSKLEMPINPWCIILFPLIVPPLIHLVEIWFAQRLRGIMLSKLKDSLKHIDYYHIDDFGAIAISVKEQSVAIVCGINCEKNNYKSRKDIEAVIIPIDMLNEYIVKNG